MKEHKNIYPITIMARLLKVSISRFYDWLKRGMSKRATQRNRLVLLIKIAHQKINESYGYIRLAKHLQSQGIPISEYAVRCIKKLNHL